MVSSEGEGGRVPRITDELGVVEFELDLEKEVETVEVDEALLVVARWTSFGERIFWAFLARSAYESLEGVAMDVDRLQFLESGRRGRRRL